LYCCFGCIVVLSLLLLLLLPSFLLNCFVAPRHGS
jgi:hypothetical protein